MTTKEAHDILREFQMWRRGEGVYESFYNKFPYTSKEVGIALDVAIETLKKDISEVCDALEDLLYMAERFAYKTPATESVIFDRKTHKTVKTINYQKTIEKAEAILATLKKEVEK